MRLVHKSVASVQQKRTHQITRDRNFKVRVKLLREVLDLTQIHFSNWLLEHHLIEVSRETINLWEAGRIPSKSYKRVLYNIIDSELERLIGDHEYR